MYRFWLFVHLGALLLFVAGHGTSAAVGTRLRRGRDPIRMAALLDASAAARTSTYGGMALLGAGGLVDAFLSHWWSAGWVWTSIGVFVAMSVVLVALAIPYYRALRLAVAAAARDAAERGDRAPVHVADPGRHPPRRPGRPGTDPLADDLQAVLSDHGVGVRNSD